MTKGDAIDQAQWRAEYENHPCAVIKSIRHKGKFQTESFSQAIPESEIVEIMDPIKTRQLTMGFAGSEM